MSLLWRDSGAEACEYECARVKRTPRVFQRVLVKIIGVRGARFAAANGLARVDVRACAVILRDPPRGGPVGGAVTRHIASVF